ncbi:MAG: recombinase family protein [Candidatus Faecenecus gallistercoris]|nr:recombinase family protein [Bacillota bacterium]MDY4050633.1 recombinase family protein [Candidatus Faecenecus gallistercoris]
MKAGLYARVSTDSQLEGYSIDAQKEFLLSYAKSKDYTEFEYYIDGGYSGKDLNRPAIQKLIEDCKNHKIDAVFVFKLDRISRSQRDTLYLIEEVFNKYDVSFVSMRENFDTSTPFGKAMIGVLSVFAQLERETILERTRIGLKKRAEAGLWRGGGKIPFPYRYDRNTGTLIPIPEQVELLHKMISLYISGKSFNVIGKIVGMDESMVETRILSITNTGKVPYKDEVYDGQHEAVVSDELYEEILRVNKVRSREKYERHYLLSGKVFCGHCGAKYRYQKWGKRLIMYCYSQQKSKPRYIKDPNCNNKRWDTFEVEDAVLEELFKMSLDLDLFKKTFNIATVNVKNEYRTRLEEITKQINNLLNNIASGIAVLETNKKINELEKEKETIEEKLTQSEQKEKDNKVSLNMIKNLKATWFDMDFDEQRRIIEHLIYKVIVNDNEINIYYNIY